MAVKNCFIRGSVVRYVQLPAEHVDTQLLEDATRRGGFRYNLRGEGNKEMSDYCPLANRSCDSSQAVTVCLPSLQYRFAMSIIIIFVRVDLPMAVLSQYTSPPNESHGPDAG